jgi:hypothetical protein
VTGASGAAGPLGPQGPVGPTGPVGPPGPPGSATTVPTTTLTLLSLDDRFNPYFEKLQQQPPKYDPKKHVDNSFVESLVNLPKVANGNRGELIVGEIADGQAINGSLYYSTTHNSLVYKDARGKIFQITLKELPRG